MRMMDAMVGCDHEGEIEIGPWPDETGWSDRYDATFGACYTARHTMTPALQLAMLFNDFHMAVYGYAIPAEAAHREFLKIDEYRWHIAADMPGAEPMPIGREDELKADLGRMKPGDNRSSNAKPNEVDAACPPTPTRYRNPFQPIGPNGSGAALLFGRVRT